jgi:hypothetical protein
MLRNSEKTKFLISIEFAPLIRTFSGPREVVSSIQTGSLGTQILEQMIQRTHDVVKSELDVQAGEPYTTGLSRVVITSIRHTKRDARAYWYTVLLNSEFDKIGTLKVVRCPKEWYEPTRVPKERY